MQMSPQTSSPCYGRAADDSFSHTVSNDLIRTALPRMFSLSMRVRSDRGGSYPAYASVQWENLNSDKSNPSGVLSGDGSTASLNDQQLSQITRITVLSGRPYNDYDRRVTHIQMYNNAQRLLTSGNDGVSSGVTGTFEMRADEALTGISG